MAGNDSVHFTKELTSTKDIQERMSAGSEPESTFQPDANRGQWAKKTEFILSCLGYAIGIGNVWRFPYLCYRSGGGAFLVPYFLMLFLCGIPLFYMEVLLGQFSSTGCISLFRMCPLFKGAGYAIVIVNFLCLTYYSVIISYPLMYFYHSLSSELPWVDCGNPWNTPNCTRIIEMRASYYVNNTSEAPSKHTPSDEFFHRHILQLSSSIGELGGVVMPLFWCLVISWVVIFLCIIKGVKSIGKVVYFSAIFPFVILVVLFFRGITLPGASLGIKFYMYPHWEKLVDLRTWSDAAMQIFFSLGPGWGGIINMASYNDFRNNARWDSVIVSVTNCGTSIFAGFVVFSVLGYLSEKTGVPVADVATSGPGLVFVTYPEAIAMLRYPQFWSVIFFLMLFFLGLDSAFVQIEAITSALTDEFVVLRAHRLLITGLACVAMFLFSIIMITRGGMYVLQLLDWYSASAPVIFICLIEVIIIGRIYAIRRFAFDIYFMTGMKASRVWLFLWKTITPIILIVIFFTSIIFMRRVSFNGVDFPDWAVTIGWCSCALSVIWIPVYMVYILAKQKGSFIERLREVCYPRQWYPAAPHHKEEYLRLRKIFETGAEVFGLESNEF